MKKYTTAQRLIAAFHLRMLTTRYGFNTTPAQRETLKTLAKIAGNFARLSVWSLFNNLADAAFDDKISDTMQCTLVRLAGIMQNMAYAR